jgi:spore coat protein U-like protein
MRRLLVAVLVLCAASSAARAAPSCRNITATALAFGNYDVYAATPVDSAGTITYNCPPPALPTVTIDLGLSFGNGHRRMSLGGIDFLEYEIYVDAARTTVWSSTTAVPVPQGNNGSVPFYGRITPLQDVSVGAYTDTVVVTFNF